MGLGNEGVSEPVNESCIEQGGRGDVLSPRAERARDVHSEAADGERQDE